MIMQDENVERVVFHFNKKHNEDQSIPQWTVKHKGVTYYVNHLVSTVGFSTKETPDNTMTKGALQFKGTLLIVNEDNKIVAYVS